MTRVLIATAIYAAALSPECGGGGGSSSSSATNFQTLAVNAGPANNYLNGAFTTVTVCLPGSSTCQTVSGVLVDTGSTGVRILANKVTLALPRQHDATGASIGECAQFADGFTWGPVVTADVRLGGEQASGVPIHLIGDTTFNAVPADCANSGAEEDTLTTLGANGILGVGLFRQDCGPACTFPGASNPGFYYTCPATGCVATTQSLAQQVQNPVWMFPADNNGVVIQLPSLPAGGAATATGMMTFGIGTQSDNALGSATVLTVDPGGNFTTVFGNVSYGSSYIDSGSNGIFFLDSATTGIPTCRVNTDFYCPPGRTTLSATNVGVNGARSSVTFASGNVDTLNGAFTAFNEVTGPNPGSFDWGLGFFYGRTVFTAIEGQTTPGGVGPYFAY